MSKNIRRFPRLLTEENLQQVLKAIMESKTYTKYGAGRFLRARDATVHVMLYYTGMRPGELLHLKWSQIDWSNRLIYIDPHSNKERNAMPVIITKPAYEALDIYKKEMKDVLVQSEYVFPSLWTWKPMTVDAMGKRVHNIFAEAGLNMVKFYTDLGIPKYEYSMYSYRRAFGTKVYNAKSDTLAVQKLLRLTTPKSVPAYIIMNDEHRRKLADDIFQ